MAHSGMVITNSGKVLQAKVQAGAVLEFTKIMLGDGVLQQSSSLEVLNTLISPKMTINISSVNAPGDGTCAISSTYTNTDLKEGFQIREMGLFAVDPDDGEILYSIDNAGDEYAYLPAGGGLSVFENNLTLVTIIGNATNVTAIIDEGKVFATKKEMVEHDADEDAHTPAFDQHNASKTPHQGGISGNAATATKLQTTRTIALGGKATGTATNFDGSNNITIPITAVIADSCTGNSATSTKLQIARTIALSGKVTGTATNFDGTSNISIPVIAVTADSCTGNSATSTKLQTTRTIALSGAATGTATNFDGSGNITIPITSLDASKLAGTTAVNTTGNAATAGKLQTARTIALSGKVAGTATNFDGTGNISIPVTSVTADSCTGNSSTATKATQDSDGNDINTTYAKKSTFASDVISALASKTLSSLGVAYSMGSTGYVAFGDLFGGLIIQWGAVKCQAHTTVTESDRISLPIKFPVTTYCVAMTTLDGFSANGNTFGAAPYDNNTVALTHWRPAGVVTYTAYILAIGR